MAKLILPIALLISFNAFAQQAAKSAYVELGGPGVASVNYDMRLQKKEGGLGFRVGIGGVSAKSDYSYGSSSSSERITILTFPLELNYLLGKDQKHYFELGAGVTVVTLKDKYNSGNSTDIDKFGATFGHLYFGYRRQPQNSGFLFRAGVCPVFDKYGFFPLWAGVSFGYKF